MFSPMKTTHLLAAFGALTALTIAGCASIGDHALVAAPVASETRETKSWDEAFLHPTALAVRAYQTGVVLTGPRILVDADDPHTPEDQKVEQWVPALSYLVRHPTRGAFLMDTGMRPVDGDGKCDFGIWPVFSAPCRAAVGQDIASQLRRDGVDPKSLTFVLVSHLHGDHAGGLRALASAGPLRVILAKEEWAAASRSFRALDGYISPMLDGSYDVTLLPMDRAVEMPYVGRALDLFGDASVWVIPTAGHTRGELSVLLNAKSGPILFTFDASHLRAGLEHSVVPGFTVDRAAARSAVDRLDALRRAYPSMQVIYGHEPTQWAGKPQAVDLTR